jgi:hypothetical protein
LYQIKKIEREILVSYAAGKLAFDTGHISKYEIGQYIIQQIMYKRM